MEDEVIKHTKKIFTTAKDKNKALIEKAIEIIAEVLIIVFAVTLSIWLHGWSEHRQQQKEVREFLSDLKEDLNNDIRSMQSTNNSLQKNIDNFRILEQLDKHGLDSIAKLNGSLHYSSSVGTTKISNGNYEGFKSSGKIGLIENKELKKHILKYYQELAPDILEAEKINAEQVLKLTDFWNDNAGRDYKVIFLDPRFKSRLETILAVTANDSEQYQQAISLAKEIIDQIDKQDN
ncbi:MAG TPA: hypothetical protein VKR32_13225 [Puia sp.]|nr:hypothetical protein [Puia sp.]